jgi:2-methyl-3-hydroxypyridine 5-carboxylic acid dioxygenase
MHAEIAGAGFAGLAAAIALRRRGWSVRVHEKEQELRAFGAGIFIWENGQRVLQAIGAYDDTARGAHRAPGYETRRNGVCVSLQKINGVNRFLLQTMTRQHLYSAIIVSAQREGIEIVTRSEAVGARPEGVLELARGRRLKADLVIAADGVRSAVRDSPGIPVARHKYQDGIVRVLVDRAPFVGGEWEHAIDFWALQPRTLRILYAPCEDGKLYFAMMSPRDDKEASMLPINPAVWSGAFPMLTPALQTIGTRGRYDEYETTHVDSWSVGRVAIVGDAAHALPPTLAQGACLAMMNALSLAAFVTGGSDVAGSLQRWEAQERCLTDHTQARSAELARTRALGAGMQWTISACVLRCMCRSVPGRRSSRVSGRPRAAATVASAGTTRKTSAPQRSRHGSGGAQRAGAMGVSDPNLPECAGAAPSGPSAQCTRWHSICHSIGMGRAR